jgi:hypothetical protein
MKIRTKYLTSITAVILFTVYTIYPQTLYKLPFASTNNRVELTVYNTSSITAKNVTVTVDSVPSWIKMKETTVSIGELVSKVEKEVTFNFDVDKKAPVGTEGVLKFRIVNLSAAKTTEQWNKEIKVTAGAPDKYELFQNYPNPFNPATTISYQLASDSKVTIKIYDLLGREVATLCNNEQKAGYYENRFNANNYASGMYIYRLTAKSNDAKSPFEYSSIKKMMLLK